MFENVYIGFLDSLYAWVLVFDLRLEMFEFEFFLFVPFGSWDLLFDFGVLFALTLIFSYER